MEALLIIAVIAIIILVNSNKEKEKALTKSGIKAAYREASHNSRELETATNTYWKNPEKNYPELHKILTDYSRILSSKYSQFDSIILLEYLVALKDSVKYLEYDEEYMSVYQRSKYYLERFSKELGEAYQFYRLSYENESLNRLSPEETKSIQLLYNVYSSLRGKEYRTEEYQKKVFTKN